MITSQDRAAKVVPLSDDIQVAVQFELNFLNIDPRCNDTQAVTTAIVRPIESQKMIFTGVAVCAPRDLFDKHTGRKVALERALRQMLPDLDARTLSHLTRKALRSIESAENLLALAKYAVPALAA
jgi:hypothetical protein